MNEAKERARKLNHAKAYKVQDWWSFHHTIPEEPGAYKFTDPDGFRVYVGQSPTNLRKRLRSQVFPARLGTATHGAYPTLHPRASVVVATC